MTNSHVLFDNELLSNIFLDGLNQQIAEKILSMESIPGNLREITQKAEVFQRNLAIARELAERQESHHLVAAMQRLKIQNPESEEQNREYSDEDCPSRQSERDEDPDWSDNGPDQGADQSDEYSYHESDLEDEEEYDDEVEDYDDYPDDQWESQHEAPTEEEQEHPHEQWQYPQEDEEENDEEEYDEEESYTDHSDNECFDCHEHPDNQDVEFNQDHSEASWLPNQIQSFQGQPLNNPPNSINRPSDDIRSYQLERSAEPTNEDDQDPDPRRERRLSLISRVLSFMIAFALIPPSQTYDLQICQFTGDVVQCNLHYFDKPEKSSNNSLFFQLLPRADQYSVRVTIRADEASYRQYKKVNGFKRVKTLQNPIRAIWRIIGILESKVVQILGIIGELFIEISTFMLTAFLLLGILAFWITLFYSLHQFLQTRKEKPSIGNPQQSEILEEENPTNTSFFVSKFHRRLPFITVILNGTSVQALLDTGSAISYLSKTMTKENINKDERRKGTLANGSTIHFLGSIRLDIVVAGVTINQKLQVSDYGECPADLLLGTDFMRTLNQKGFSITFDLERNKVFIGEKNVM